MRFFIHRRPQGQPDAPLTLVATLQSQCKREAEVLFGRLHQLSQSQDEYHDYFREFVYQLSEEIGKPSGMSHVDMEVDTSKAVFTRRPIVYHLSIRKEHGKWIYLAYHKSYGTVRGICAADHYWRYFTERVKTIWPNADLTRD